MKVFVNGIDLIDVVSKVSRAASTKGMNQVLEGIKLIAKDNSLTLYATDMEISIQKRIRADVKEEGEVILSSKKFGGYIKTLGDDIVEIEEKEGIVTIKYVDSEIKLQAMNPDQYPEKHEANKENNFVIVQREFKDMIDKCVFCAAVEEIRPILKGCLLEIKDYQLNMVALDGFRMAVVRKQLEQSSTNTNIVVPAKALDEISKLLEADEDTVTIYIEENSITAEMDSLIFTSRLIEGEYTNYNLLLTTDFNTTIAVEREKLQNAIERACIINLGEKNNNIIYEIKGSIINITSRNNADGYHESIAIRNTGMDITIAFNSKYILDILRTIKDDYIKIQFRSPTSASIICPIDSNEYTYLVLPVKIQN